MMGDDVFKPEEPKYVRLYPELFPETQRVLKEGNVPIEAILVKDDLIIGYGLNRRLQANTPILRCPDSL